MRKFITALTIFALIGVVVPVSTADDAQAFGYPIGVPFGACQSVKVDAIYLGAYGDVRYYHTNAAGTRFERRVNLDVAFIEPLHYQGVMDLRTPGARFAMVWVNLPIGSSVGWITFYNCH